MNYKSKSAIICDNESNSSGTRIAKNTLLLYVRTFCVLVISLFTSRITLQALGIENYGIQNAVGGVIGMFNIISGSLSSSISRFITFELGRKDYIKLNRIFCTSMNIQAGMSVIILIFTETIAVWFLNTQMNIPIGRMAAANWVLQCAIFSFIIGLFSVPYNASIIGHEKMSAFAYVSILEVILKLIVVYALYISPVDKLITISILNVLVAIIIRWIYAIYCKKHFEECTYRFTYDKKILKEMSGFAGWSFLTNTIWILNTQGINIIINIFFGVTMNAARGVAAMVESVLKKFTSDFTTALNPQITKTYAAGDKAHCFQLINQGARFSYYLMLVLALPLMFEAQFVLNIWLDVVPENTASFFRLSIIATLIMLIGDSGYRACMATGNIKMYTIIMTMLSILVFPFSWIAFKLGCPAEAAYIIYIIIYAVIDVVRLILMKYMLNYPPMLFVKEVLIRVCVVTVFSVILPSILNILLPTATSSSLIIIIVCIFSAITSVYVFGVSRQERKNINSKAFGVYNKIINSI